MRLPPETFWNLTPAEFQLMIGPNDQGNVLSRGRLDQLLAAFPDETGQQGDT